MTMDCLWVQMPVVKDGWEVDALSVALAMVIGAVVGGLIALGCAKLCMKDLIRKKVSRDMSAVKYGGHVWDQMSLK